MCPIGFRSDRYAVFLLSVLLMLPLTARARAKAPHLGGYPLCEASAAAWIPCPDDPGVTCLLVGDNELPQALFVFPFDGHQLDVVRRHQLDITPVLSSKDDFELADIEALTVLGSGEVLIYGSHSRNNACERKKKRRRYVSIKLQQASVIAGGIKLVRTEEDFDLVNAFPKDATGDLQTVRQAVKAAEAEADTHCEGAFNVEGAVALPGPSGDEVWVGLRAPLVDGKAVLVRHKAGLKAFEFDAARLVDLNGWGIRDLTYANGWVWGLSGPVQDDEVTSFRLWRFRVDALGHKGVIEVTQLREVPNGAEGLAVWGNVAVVLIDGSELKNPPAHIDGIAITDICKQDASYVVVSVPW